MNTLNNSLSSDEDLPADFSKLTQTVRMAAQHRTGDCLALLALLRLLDELHADIRDSLFRDALPDNRQRLYRLLRDIEQQGGWPYIQRMKLIELIENLGEDSAVEDSAESNEAAATEMD